MESAREDKGGYEMIKRTLVIAASMLMVLTLASCMTMSSDAVDQGTAPTYITVGGEEIDIGNGETVAMGGGPSPMTLPATH